MRGVDPKVQARRARVRNTIFEVDDEGEREGGRGSMVSLSNVRRPKDCLGLRSW